MFNIFKKIKQIIMKKEELEKQINDAITTAQKLGVENKQLRKLNEDLTTTNVKLTEELNGAIERVRYLAGQVKMYEAQNQASRQYNDSDKNY
jgi:FtsZ-binding cell division protein ZapB